MRNRLVRKFEVLESLRESVVASLDHVPMERLQQHPAAGKWSAAQIIAHLVKAEGRSVEYIRKKTQTPGAVPPATFMSALRTFVLVTALSGPFKFKVPEAVADVPDNPPAAEAIENWSAVRRELKAMIDTLPDDLLGRALFRHPVTGRMNMSQTLDFMIAHVRRHKKQLKRTLAWVLTKHI